MVILLEILNATQPSLIPANEGGEDESWEKHDRPMVRMERRRPGVLKIGNSAAPQIYVSGSIEDSNGTTMQILTVHAVQYSSSASVATDSLAGMPSSGTYINATFPQRSKKARPNLNNNVRFVEGEECKKETKNKDAVTVTKNSEKTSQESDKMTNSAKRQNDTVVINVEMHETINKDDKKHHHNGNGDKKLKTRRADLTEADGEDRLCQHCQEVVQALPRSVSAEVLHHTHKAPKDGNTKGHHSSNRALKVRSQQIGHNNHAFQAATKTDSTIV